MVNPTKFESLNLIGPLLEAVKAEGYETPTPIQSQAIPLVLSRKDVLACAQTGTGKTAAFALPILQLLAEREVKTRDIRVLVLTPTRELASQIAQSFSDYGKKLPFRNAVVFGGVAQKAQVRALNQGVDILVATPGRLLDLMHQRLVGFRGLEILVLDEADRMLDMGFIHDVRRIIAAIPKNRQTLFFSATMPPEIRKLSEQILSRPVRIEVTPVATTAEKIVQAVVHVDKRHKTSLLIHLIEKFNVERALVFTRTKRDANRVAGLLNGAGIKADAIHGNKSQSARENALDRIKKGHCRVLVATDIAARGIDIDRVTHVFNYDIPNVPESYVHRIGRTARGGMEGEAFALCSSEERAYLADIERVTRQKIPVLPLPEGLTSEKAHKPSQQPRRHSGNQNRHNSQNRKPGSPHARSAHAKPGQAKPSSDARTGHHNPPPSPNNRRQRRKQARPQGA
ncbi:MAG: DEAD/DEAH box helicase [Bdellovibrionia bacterium]